jgi:hypothetical protein
MRRLDSDNHAATAPAPACAEAQECAVPMAAVQAQLKLDTAALIKNDPDLLRAWALSRSREFRADDTRRNQIASTF